MEFVSKLIGVRNRKNEARRMYSLASNGEFKKKGTPEKRLISGASGAPKRIRTSGLPLRRRSLYPAELRKQTGKRFCPLPIVLYAV